MKTSSSAVFIGDRVPALNLRRNTTMTKLCESGSRSSSRTIVFARPFRLTAIDRLLPAGTYIVETDEELLQTLSFPAYRRVATWLRLPAPPGSAALDQVLNIDPAELELALAVDTQPTRPAR
jgi:hypothetical protein